MKSFQALRKVKAARVTRMGRMTGSATSRKMANSPAPSMRAASSSSSGTPSAYCRTRKMPNTLARYGTITPA